MLSYLTHSPKLLTLETLERINACAIFTADTHEEENEDKDQKVTVINDISWLEKDPTPVLRKNSIYILLFTHRLECCNNRKYVCSPCHRVSVLF